MIDMRLGDAHELIRTLPDGSVHAIITDPPYGIFKEADAVLDTPPKPEIWRECYRVAKGDAWLAVFAQMPILAQWHSDITGAGWRYVEHIVWLKRTQTPAPSGLLRSHESILLYRKGKAQLVDKTAPYWDTKIPLLDVGGLDVESLQRHFAELYRYAKTGRWGIRHNADARFEVHRRHKSQGRQYQDYECTNVGNVWSFVQTPRYRERTHPAMKPLPLLERLVRLLTREGEVVLDPFLGSGTTAVACAKLGRRCIGFEWQEKYLQVARERVREAVGLLEVSGCP